MGTFRTSASGPVEGQVSGGHLVVPPGSVCCWDVLSKSPQFSCLLGADGVVLPYHHSATTVLSAQVTLGQSVVARGWQEHTPFLYTAPAHTGSSAHRDG